MRKTALVALSVALLSANLASAEPLMLLVDDDYPDADLPYCVADKKPDGTCRPKSSAPTEESWPFRWITSYPGLFCRSYFALKEAEAALRERDERWLRQTGCFQARRWEKVTLIETPLGGSLNIWRGRFSGENFYFNETSVVNYARSGPYKDRTEAKNALNVFSARLTRGTEYTFAVDKQNNVHLLIGPSYFLVLNKLCSYKWEYSCEVPELK